MGLEGIVEGVPAATSLAGVGFRIGSFATGVSGEAGDAPGAASTGADKSGEVLLIGPESVAGGFAAGWVWSFGEPAGLSAIRREASGGGVACNVG